MMLAGRCLILTALAASLLAPVAGAADTDGDRFEEKRFYVTPFLGFTLFDRERQFLSGVDLPNDFYFGGRAGVRLSHSFWLDFAGGYTPVTTCCDWVEWTHFSGNLMLSPASSRRVNPFLSLGGGWSSYKHSIGSAEKLGTFEVAGGLRVRLSEMFGVRLEARNILALPKAPIRSAHMDDIILGAGLNVAFGGGDEERVAEAPCSDSDHDGVCDGLDRCPNTAPGVVVDPSGCVVVVAVPEVAAPVVEAPEIKVREKELLDTGMLRISDINFDFDKSEIRPDSYHTLDVVGKVLTKWPGLRIQIDGHTDSRGRNQYNLALSHRRAESVRAYLLTHFAQFTPEQLTARGYGESEPLVVNDSEEHMATNRRVEFKALNKELLQRDK